MSPYVSRRDFLKTSAVAGSALVVGCTVPGGGRLFGGSDAVFEPNAWVAVDGDGIVTVVVDDMELGQGVLTALPMMVAEELAIDWEDVRTEYGVEDPSTWPRSISTGGSTSTRTSWEPLRRAGAAARAMLIAAAAAEWQVDAPECRAERGEVVHEASGRRLAYGSLVEAAAALPVPEDPPLLDPSEFRIIGTPLPRRDSPVKVDGSHIYSLDLRVPGMLYAAMARCPVPGGTVRSYDDAAARQVAGVRDVVQISNGVAVLADHTWAAFQGRDALEVEWDEGPVASWSSEGLWREYEALADGPGAVARDDGDAAGAIARAPGGRRVQAIYRAPFLAHAPMEPMNCTAHVREGACDVWAPTQRLTEAQEIAAEAAGLPVGAVVMHAIPPGGGFGRRLENDYVREAVEVSRAVGVPVKVVWTREDDMRHGVFRPAAHHQVAGAVGADGTATAWSHRVVAPSVPEWSRPGSVDGVDGDAVAGLDELPYAIPNVHVSYAMAPRGVPVGWWRAVGHTHTAFAHESFVDELAHAAGRDPYEFRQSLLRDHPRHLGVLDAAAEAADWGGPVPAGRGRGIAVVHAFRSYVAQVAEASVENGRIRVHHVWCAVDCGQVVNPRILEQQVQSGVIFGLTAALFSKITFENGRVKQSNFDTYPLLRMTELPEIHAVVVPSMEDPTGVGEPGVPPVAPAVANAVFAATGRRLRTLPFELESVPVA